MRSGSVIRKIDDLGRVVLPSELRKTFGIREGDELEISVDGERVVLTKRQDHCTFCGADDPSLDYRDRRVCESCADDLAARDRIGLRVPDADSIELP